ncbi:sensor histidine kinase [Dyadobacter diqingensis]|uniref:sensor histidine kinase n=1 Tax=Dyadobacter diqingensis TaxID=2938121 RepID=UPI0020C23E05|nr:7TM diverse intracellular signaling domain-containing protein [Dyadobacter diqingensis]
MIKYVTLIVLVFIVSELKSQDLVSIKPDFKSVAFSRHLEYFIDSTDSYGLRQAMLSKDWKLFVGSNPDFGINPLPHWLRFSIQNDTKEVKTLTLLTKGLDSLQAYLTIGDSLVKTFPVTGSHIPLRYRENSNAYLSLTFDVLPGQKYRLWTRVRNLNFRLTVSPFTLYEKSEAKQYLQQKLFFQSLYIGGMTIMLLFSIVLMCLFRDWMYAYYFGCVLCSVSIMLIYNDYTFLLFDDLPKIIYRKDIYGILSTMIPCLYVLFAEKFLRVSPTRLTLLPMIARGMVLLQLAPLAYLYFSGVTLFHLHGFFYGPMLILGIIPLVYLTQAIRRGYRPAWLFLLATVPISAIVALETSSDFHKVAVQEIHEYYYYATLFEMFALTFGLAYRFKLDFDQRRLLQREILLTQITTQEKERTDIAADLHDVIGSQISAAKLNVEYIQEQYFPDSEKNWWAPVYKVLNLLSENISSIADKMRNSSLDKLGLAGILEQMYGHIKTPVFHFDFIGMQKRIPAYAERVLYVIIIEALNNCIKHSEATEINIQLVREKNLLTVIIEDNGIGFDPERVKRGQGLKNMEIRVEEYLQGELLIDSQPGSGTVIIIKVALKEET